MNKLSQIISIKRFNNVNESRNNEIVRENMAPAITE